MYNLSGIQTHVSNSRIRLELAKAGINAFEGEVSGKRPVDSTIAGVLKFFNGVEALFVRSWSFWSVALSEPLPIQESSRLQAKWFEVVRAQCAPSGGVKRYSVSTQEGLNALVSASKRAFGAETLFEANELVAHPDGLVRGSLTLVCPPAGRLDLARFEIAGLVALGGQYARYQDKEECYLEALRTARCVFGRLSSTARRLEVTLSDLYRDTARQKQALLPFLTSDTDRYVATAELERLLTMRQSVLQSLGRHKEADSVERACAPVREALAAIYRARREHFRSQALERNRQRVQDSWLEFTYAPMQLELVLKRMGARTSDFERIHDDSAAALKMLSGASLAELGRRMQAD